MIEENNLTDTVKSKEKVKRRAGKLFIGIGLTSVILIVATYAWFIGTTEVMVNEFEVNVRSSDGLQVSLDAVTWAESVDVGEEEVTTDLAGDSESPGTYPTHTNHWVDDVGLDAISSVGTMDTTNSVLTLFDKASLTSLQGGYKLRTSQIQNYDTTNNKIDEQGSYIVFDLFVKNSSGTDYSSTYSPADAEGIYLSSTSSVTISSEGTGGDGIENSVRIAFMEIGRVFKDASAAAAQSISCTSTQYPASGGEGTPTTITSVCNRGIPGTPTEQNQNPSDTGTGQGITWNIYEPNDTAHSADSIAHFARVCKQKTVANNETTYSGACTAIVNGTATSTYAVNDEITAADDVNIYDGINGYTTVSNKLTLMDYFTDTEKMAVPDSRQEIFFLAPNSVTKIRVYIWLEGQDVDNYDLGTIGKKVVITFGFTKDKFNTTAIASPSS